LCDGASYHTCGHTRRSFFAHSSHGCPSQITGMRFLPVSSVHVTVRMNIESGSSGVVMKIATVSFIIRIGMIACRISDSGANCASSTSRMRSLSPRIPW
jgi:hypothetical protein